MSARFWEALSSVILSFVATALLVVFIVVTSLAIREYLKPQPPAEFPPGYVLRRLEIRLHEPLDKGRGDRYRVFECTEVPLGSPREKP